MTLSCPVYKKFTGMLQQFESNIPPFIPQPIQNLFFQMFSLLTNTTTRRNTATSEITFKGCHRSSTFS